RETEGEQQARRAVSELARLTCERAVEGLRQALGGDSIQGLDAVAERVTVGETGGDRRGDIAIEAVQRRRHRALLPGHEVVERYQLAVARTHAQALQIIRLVAERAIELPDDLILLAVHHEIPEALIPEGELQGARDVQ